ncbi:MAG: MFS transporter [Solirubrobacterales bacterium]|nr:MFS transporter [Solirubrobacterales bacterium]
MTTVTIRQNAASTWTKSRKSYTAAQGRRAVGPLSAPGPAGRRPGRRLVGARRNRWAPGTLAGSRRRRRPIGVRIGRCAARHSARRGDDLHEATRVSSGSEGETPRSPPASRPRPSGRSALATGLLIVGALLIAANLRPAITSVGPLIGEIRADTGLSGTAAGLLTTLPVLAFGLLSPVAPRLGHRFGIEAVLLGCMVALVVGIVVRWAPGTVALFGGTVILGAAVASANVLLPALVKRDYAHREGLVTAAYSSVLGGAAGIGAGVAVPLADDAGLGWEGALAIWAVPATVAALVWLPQARRRHRPAPGPGPGTALRDLWRSRLAWTVTGFWAMQSFGFYVVIAWLPEILIEAGLDDADAGLMLFVAQVAGVAATLTIPPLAGRRPDQRGIVVASAAVLVLAVLGLIAAPDTATVVWVLLLGFGQGCGLSLALLFLPLRTREHRTAAELSGMAQTVGYLVAATGPILAGLLHDGLGGWKPTLVLLLAAAAAQLAFGLGAGRDAVLGIESRPRATSAGR